MPRRSNCYHSSTTGRYSRWCRQNDSSNGAILSTFAHYIHRIVHQSVFQVSILTSMYAAYCATHRLCLKYLGECFKVCDEPLFTLIWHRTAHLLKLHLQNNGQAEIEWILFSTEGLKTLISTSLSVFR